MDPAPTPADPPGRALAMLPDKGLPACCKTAPGTTASRTRVCAACDPVTRIERVRLTLQGVRKLGHNDLH